MTTFQDRERAFEAKFAHDEEVRFLATARRDKLVAQWAASQLALPQAAADALTRSVLALRDGEPHDELLLQHLAALFEEHGVSTTRAELSTTLARCAAQARDQLLHEQPQHFDPT